MEEGTKLSRELLQNIENSYKFLTCFIFSI